MQMHTPISNEIDWKQQCRDRHETALEWRARKPFAGAPRNILRVVSPGEHEGVADEGGASQSNQLCSAIALAKPYDRIEVSPGRYTGNLLVQHPLEIVGTGPLGSVTVLGFVVIRATHVRLVNLSIESPTPGNGASGPAVKIFAPDSSDRSEPSAQTPSALHGAEGSAEDVQGDVVQVEECQIRGTVEVRQSSVALRRNDLQGSICVTGLRESQQNVSPALPKSPDWPVVGP